MFPFPGWLLPAHSPDPDDPLEPEFDDELELELELELEELPPGLLLLGLSQLLPLPGRL